MGKVKTGDLNNWSHCISRQEEESKEDSAHFLLFIQCSIPAKGMVPHKSINLSTIIPQSMSIGQVGLDFKFTAAMNRKPTKLHLHFYF